MAWIESHQELGAHPKTRKLATDLGIHRMQAVGHLHALWWWALDYADDGDLTDFGVQDIAMGAEWDGDPEEFVAALIGCGPGSRAGFLDETEGGLRIHDWDRHTEGLQASKERSRKGNHERWHVQRGVLDDSCDLCRESPRESERESPEQSPGSPQGVPRDIPEESTVPTRPTRPTKPTPTPPNPPKADLVLDEEKSDPGTGLEVWIDHQGKVRQRRDGLWEAASEIWGDPATKSERGKRNREVAELREAGIHPDQLAAIVEKAIKRWGGKARPGLAGIVRNLGDLLNGFEMPSVNQLSRYEASKDRQDLRERIMGGHR